MSWAKYQTLLPPKKPGKNHETSGDRIKRGKGILSRTLVAKGFIPWPKTLALQRLPMRGWIFLTLKTNAKSVLCIDLGNTNRNQRKGRKMEEEKLEVLKKIEIHLASISFCAKITAFVTACFFFTMCAFCLFYQLTK